MTHLTTSEAAIVAAAQASEATAELLRFAREGAVSDRRSFESEPIEKLAEALKLTIGIELGDEPVGIDDRAKLNELHGVLTDFIEGWAG